MVKDKVVESDEIYQRMAHAELKLKDQVLIEQEMIKLQNILTMKLEQNDQLREQLSALQMDYSLNGVSANEREKTIKMLSEIKTLSNLLQEKNDDNQIMRVELLKL